MFFLCGIRIIHAQTQVGKSGHYSLQQIIDIAKTNSPGARIIKQKYLAAYWTYKSYKASKKPALILNGTLPSINRGIERITQFDGTDAFRARSLANYDLGLSINEDVPLTGGKVFLSSGVQRIDLFGSNPSTSYLSTPLSIGFTQPIFAFNELKWKSRIEPLKYDESISLYFEALERISTEAAGFFFGLLGAEMDYEINKKNYSNNDTILKIAKGRYNLGKIAENELLQIELSFLNSGNALERSRIDLEIAKQELKKFLGFSPDERLELIPEIPLNPLQISPEMAVKEALKNSASLKSIERKKLETLMNLKIRDQGFVLNMTGSYGLTQSGASIDAAYSKPQDQQQFLIGFSAPIWDWGHGRADSRIAQADYAMEETRLNQEQKSGEQEVYFKALRFNILKDQLFIASRADTVANKRYEVTKQRYMIGKIDITTLNIASSEKDLAKRHFFEALRNYWTDYYEIRRLTLYDFELNQPLLGLDLPEVK